MNDQINYQGILSYKNYQTPIFEYNDYKSKQFLCFMLNKYQFGYYIKMLKEEYEEDDHENVNTKTYILKQFHDWSINNIQIYPIFYQIIKKSQIFNPPNDTTTSFFNKNNQNNFQLDKNITVIGVSNTQYISNLYYQKYALDIESSYTLAYYLTQDVHNNFISQYQLIFNQHYQSMIQIIQQQELYQDQLNDSFSFMKKFSEFTTSLMPIKTYKNINQQILNNNNLLIKGGKS